MEVRNQYGLMLGIILTMTGQNEQIRRRIPRQTQTHVDRIEARR